MALTTGSAAESRELYADLKQSIKWQTACRVPENKSDRAEGNVLMADWFSQHVNTYVHRRLQLRTEEVVTLFQHLRGSSGVWNSNTLLLFFSSALLQCGGMNRKWCCILYFWSSKTNIFRAAHFFSRRTAFSPVCNHAVIKYCSLPLLYLKLLGYFFWEKHQNWADLASFFIWAWKLAPPSAGRTGCRERAFTVETVTYQRAC